MLKSSQKSFLVLTNIWKLDRETDPEYGMGVFAELLLNFKSIMNFE